MVRQDSLQGAPCQLAVADFATASAAHTARLTDGIWREVIVQQEAFLAGTVQAVDILFVV